MIAFDSSARELLNYWHALVVAAYAEAGAALSPEQAAREAIWVHLMFMRNASQGNAAATPSLKIVWPERP